MFLRKQKRIILLWRNPLPASAVFPFVIPPFRAPSHGYALNDKPFFPCVNRFHGDYFQSFFPFFPARSHVFSTRIFLKICANFAHYRDSRQGLVQARTLLITRVYTKIRPTDFLCQTDFCFYLCFFNVFLILYFLWYSSVNGFCSSRSSTSRYGLWCPT